MADWPIVRLECLAATTRNAIVGGPFGSDLVSADYVSDGVPVVRGENLSDRRWVGGDFVYVTTAKAGKLVANTAGPLDIVFTQRGANHYRQVAAVPPSSPRMLISQSQMKVTVDRQRVDPLFIYYVFKSPEMQDHLRRHAIQTGVPHTNLGILKSVPVPLPPLREQLRIVEILSALDDKIELNLCLSETLEATARALFQSWFVDFDPVLAKSEGRDPGLAPDMAGLFPDGFEGSELGEIPVGWRVSPIGELADVRGGSTPRTDEPAFWEGGQHCWATPKDLSRLSTPVLLDTERRVTDAGLGQIGSGLLPPGTVLLSSRAPIGYLAIAEIPVAINQGFIAMQPADGIPSLFLLNWARCASDEIVSRANGSTFLEISKANFRPIPVITPPAPVLEAFNHLAAPAHSRIVANDRSIRTLANLRDTLMPRLISGELRLRAAGQPVEAVPA